MYGVGSDRGPTGQELIKTTGTGLIDLHGIGPSGAARLLVEVGDVTRFPDRGHFASWTGTAPIDASSGDHRRHRLSRAGNRQINMVQHMMAVVQLRNPTEGRAYYDRKIAAGDPHEAMRCLKRRLSDIVYRTMLNDWSRARRRAREDTGARHINPARPAHIPTPALRTSHFPNPPRPSLGPHSLLLLDGKDGGRLGDLRPGFCLDSAPGGLDALFVICRPEAAEAFQRHRAGQT
jgi:Transposase IS116/IS110/IS902 family